MPRKGRVEAAALQCGTCLCLSGAASLETYPEVGRAAQISQPRQRRLSRTFLCRCVFSQRFARKGAAAASCSSSVRGECSCSPLLSISDRGTWVPRQRLLRRPPRQEGRAGWGCCGGASGGSTVPPSRVATRRGLKRVPVPYRALPASGRDTPLTGRALCRGSERQLLLFSSCGFSRQSSVGELCRATAGPLPPALERSIDELGSNLVAVRTLRRGQCARLQLPPER